MQDVTEKQFTLMQLEKTDTCKLCSLIGTFTNSKNISEKSFQAIAADAIQITSTYT
jgi:hypothetical protein